MAEGKITEYIDRAGVTSSTTFMLDQLNQVKDAFDKVNGIKVTLGKDNSFSTVTSSVKQVSASMTELQASVQQYNNILSQSATTQAKLTVAGTEAAAQLAQQKLQLAQVTTETKNQAKEALGLVDAYEKLKIQYAAVSKEAKNLQVIAQQTGKAEDISAAAASTANAKQLHDQLLQVEQAVGQSQRNVGNYTGALQILEGALADASAHLQQLTAAGQQNTAAFASTAEEVQLLTQVVNKQAGGFSSVIQEIRTTERALQTLKDSTFAQTGAFEQLRETTTTAAQEAKEFSRQQKLLEGEAPLLGALTLAAKGLAGVYAVGAGAVSLFADGNEKAEKELNKLVAIMTILQGLNEAYTLTQQAGAVATAIRTAVIKGATAVNSLFATSETAAAVATTELAVANTAAIEPTVAETVALEAQAAAAGNAAVGMEAAAVAGEAATVAFSATGIGAVILVVAAAVFVLVEKIQQWNHENELTIKQQGEIADAVKEANQAILDQADFIAKLDNSTTRGYEQALAQSKATGDNKLKQFAIEKALNKSQHDDAQAVIDQLGATNEKQGELAGTIQDLTNKKQAALDISLKLNAIPEAQRTSEQNRELKSATTLLDLYGKQLSSITPLYQAGQKAREDLFKTNETSAEQELALEKFTIDERRKYQLNAVQVEVSMIQNKNAIILGSDRSSYAQRLAALQSNLAEQKKLAEAQLNNVLSDKSATPADRLIAESKYNEAIKNETENSLKAQADLKESYRLRDLAADSAIRTSQIKEEQSKNDEIVKNDNNSLADRLDAYQKYVQDSQKLANEEYETKLKAAGFSQAEIDAIAQGDKVSFDKKKIDLEELRALVQEHNDKLKEIANNTGKSVYDITVSWAKKQEAAVLQSNKLNDDPSAVEKRYQDDFNALNVSLEKKTISIAEYNDARLRLEQKYQGDVATITIAADKKSIEALKDQQDEIKTQISDAQGGLNDAIASGDIDRIDSYEEMLQALYEAQDKNNADILVLIKKLNSDINKENLRQGAIELKHQQDMQNAKNKLIEEGFTLAKTLNDAGFENDVNKLQDQIDAINKTRDAQIAAETASTDAAQVKADKLLIINQTAAYQTDVLAQKQKQDKIKEAEIDKQLAVAQIVERTAVAVVSALGSIPFTPANIALAEAVGAIGLAEIAIAEATPIPHYKGGVGKLIGGQLVGGHPGGPAVLGDGGVSELAITPSGDMYVSPNHNTLVDLPENSVVLPDINDFLNSVIMNSFGMSVDAPRETVNIASEFRSFTKQVVGAINSKPVAIINNTHSGVQMGLKKQNSYTEWVNRNMQSKRV